MMSFLSKDPEVIPMRRLTVSVFMFTFLPLLIASCGEKRSAGDKKLAAAGQPLVGKWREVQEFGGSKRPVAEQTVMILGKTSYTSIQPKSVGNPPMKGTWRVKDVKGKTLLIGLTLDLGGSPMPADDQRVKLVDKDTLEWRNAKNGHGGIYKRAN
jgi:hypothetical protein